MAGNEKSAKKYAKALFDSVEKDSLEATRDSLKQLADAWSSSIELRAALLNPATPQSQRLAVVKDIAKLFANANQKFENFCLLLLENGRLEILPQIAEDFSKLVDTLKEVARLEITSAFPISNDEKEKILDLVRKQAGSLAAIEWQVNPELLGGLQIKSGDKLLDASLQGSLEKAKSALMA